MANSSVLKIVLISSDLGSILPIIEELSARNRALIYEVDDIGIGDAVQYMKKQGFTENVAEKLVDSIGGRLVYLESAVFKNGVIDQNDDKMCEKILDELFALTITVQKSAISDAEPESSIILDVMSERDNVLPSELITCVNVKDRVRMKDAIDKLLS